MMFTVDDFGISAQANKLIFEAFEKGVLTHASVMVNMPGSRDALGSIKQYPQITCGLHLNISEHTGWKQLLTKTSLGFINKRALEHDIRGQIEILQHYVANIPFINSHHNVHFWPSIYGIVASVAEQYGIQYIRFPKHFAGRGVKPAIIRLAGSRSELTIVKPLSEAWLDLDWYPERVLTSMISNVPENCEISCHPLMFQKNQKQSTLQWLIDHKKQLN